MDMNNRGPNHSRSESANGVDRRYHSRYELIVPVTFQWKGDRGVRHRAEGYTRDVSKHGVFVLTNSCPPAESVLRIEVHLPPLKRSGSPVQMRGRAQVVRIEAGNGIGSHGFAARVGNFTLHSKVNGRLREAREVSDMAEIQQEPANRT